MMKLTVLYPHPTDPAQFDAYYRETHTPLVHKIPGLVRFEDAHVVATPDGSPPPYFLIAELYFDNMESFQAGMASPEGQATAADVPNFASNGATLMICDITS
ncbi:ethyl tert-butyl ether degradation protein EthD [Deinococcus aerolatus]|uniref:Ethyl tert-butyl ether degradation protein EthD n=1 Tax=Deinococcus aerolatus TaxID=522487 RepID=A0ABQ2GBV1_9DEIO|nr:EthD family reductase [Deinococcus aerolatus]GGL83593.1 ethyl tert-butyl ether degradation protein EthD [Deinococcus aerolatus]